MRDSGGSREDAAEQVEAGAPDAALAAREARLDALIRSIRPPAAADPAEVRRHLDDLTKPPGSLGRVEEVALALARIFGDPPPRLDPRVVFVLAADHGVAARGVSAYPSEVTGQMCRNFAAGGAAINAIAGAVGARVVAVDIGVAADLSGVEGLVHRKVRPGSRDLSAGPALTRDEVVRSVLVGADLVAEVAPEAHLIGLGEMGIGNTTAAAAMAAALTGAGAPEVVGRGTGIDEERWRRKVEIVGAATARIPDGAGPLEALAEVGGLEIAGLAGVLLGAAARGRAVVTDGFIATSGALAAVRLAPAATDYLFASHLSVEPGHGILLEALGARPLLDLELRLGEGTGAALAFPILDAGAAILREMATFSGAGVSGRGEEG